MSTGLLHPDVMGPNWPGPRGFRDLPIGIDGLYLSAAGSQADPTSPSSRANNAGYQVLDDIGSR